MSFVKKFIEPPEAQPPCYETEEEMKAKYKYWRFRQLYATFIGYAVYYFVRKNIALAVPLMTDPASGLGLTKADLGKVMSFGDVVYGVSKSFNGFLGDRCNPRYFMAFGLLMSALANFFFGISGASTAGSKAWEPLPVPASLPTGTTPKSAASIGASGTLRTRSVSR